MGCILYKDPCLSILKGGRLSEKGSWKGFKEDTQKAETCHFREYAPVVGHEIIMAEFGRMHAPALGDTKVGGFLGKGKRAQNTKV